MSKGCSIIQEERSLVLGHQAVERVLPLLVQFQAEDRFSLSLLLGALGVIHQMLREPWFKQEKGGFIWYSMEMRLVSTGVFPEVSGTG